MSAKVEKVSMEVFEKEAAKPRRGAQGKWNTIIADITKDKQPRKVSGLTRGSISAGSRAARDAGFRYVTQYPTKEDKEGYIIIAYQEPTKEEAPPEKIEASAPKKADKKK